MGIDLLHFGSGLQAVHYAVMCFVAILGIIQAAAIQFKLRDLVWLDGKIGYVLASTSVILAFVWFFYVDDEIFIPGLAGGELFTVFASAFVAAVPATRLVNWIIIRLRSLAPESQKGPATQEEEPLL